MLCPHCGIEITENQAYCQYCGVPLGCDSGYAADRPGRSKPAWEDREQQGLLGSLVTTVRNVLFEPAHFFRNMRVQGGMTDPLLFGLIIGMVGMMFVVVWDMLLHNAMPVFMVEMDTGPGGTWFQGSGIAALAVTMPFVLIVTLFVSAGVLHLLLFLVRGARAGFEATFRVVCYGMAPSLFLIIPYFGSLITMVWCMILTVIGLREAHGTTGGKAAFVVFFPLLFFLGLVILALAFLMGAAAASFGDLLH